MRAEQHRDILRFGVSFWDEVVYRPVLFDLGYWGQVVCCSGLTKDDDQTLAPAWLVADHLAQLEAMHVAQVEPRDRRPWSNGSK